MEPDVVLFLTGFPVNTSLQYLSLVAMLFNVQGNSFAASMPPLIAAMLSLRLRGLKFTHLDILLKAYDWDKCKEDDPWRDDEEDMKAFAQLIKECDFACIFSAGRLATDKLRDLSCGDVGTVYDLPVDRHAFKLENDVETLVFTAFHPQVNPSEASAKQSCVLCERAKRAQSRDEF
jgi:hypothetical protein